MSSNPLSFHRSLILGAVALVVTGAGLYGTHRLLGNVLGNRAGGSCAASATMAPRLAPFAKGELAGLKVEHAPQPMTPISFDGPNGERRDIASFGGRTVLLNLWATWCEPCKREMPALDKLQADLGGPGFEVAAVNIDTRNLDRPKAWLAENGISRLAYYHDAKAAIFQDLRRAGEVEGLPTTILVGPDGCKLGKLSGWAEWASADGLALMRAAIPGGR